MCAAATAHAAPASKEPACAPATPAGLSPTARRRARYVVMGCATSTAGARATLGSDWPPAARVISATLATMVSPAPQRVPGLRTPAPIMGYVTRAVPAPVPAPARKGTSGRRAPSYAMAGSRARAPITVDATAMGHVRASRTRSRATSRALFAMHVAQTTNRRHVR